MAPVLHRGVSADPPPRPIFTFTSPMFSAHPILVLMLVFLSMRNLLHNFDMPASPVLSGFLTYIYCSGHSGYFSVTSSIRTYKPDLELLQWLLTSNVVASEYVSLIVACDHSSCTLRCMVKE
uniref:Transmembrane protein n=1 Tax=Heterorhabditis bacteriophora TaxID=37862 RepID=A0A1I7WP31_HETBA